MSEPVVHLRTRVLVLALAAFLGLAAPVGAQVKAPTVVDYFVNSPFLRHAQGIDERQDHWLHLAPDGPLPSTADDAWAKQVLLDGNSLSREQPVKDLVIDTKNGFLRVSLEFDDLTLVYFERADRSRVVAVRLEDTSGPFWTQDWAFFNVEGDHWDYADTVFPEGWLRAYLPQEPSATEADYLALTAWDIDLPRLGTTVHLTPQPFGSDLEGPGVMVSVPATDREVDYGAYIAWFQKVFCDADKTPRSLELKWNKVLGRFEAGKVAVWKN